MSFTIIKEFSPSEICNLGTEVFVDFSQYVSLILRTYKQGSSRRLRFSFYASQNAIKLGLSQIDDVCLKMMHAIVATTDSHDP